MLKNKSHLSSLLFISHRVVKIYRVHNGLIHCRCNYVLYSNSVVSYFRVSIQVLLYILFQFLYKCYKLHLLLPLLVRHKICNLPILMMLYYQIHRKLHKKMLHYHCHRKLHTKLLLDISVQILHKMGKFHLLLLFQFQSKYGK